MFLSADDPDPEKPSGTEAGMEALVSFPCPLRPTHCASPLSLVPVLGQAALDRCKGGSPAAPGVKSQHEFWSARLVKECWGGAMG